MSSSKILGCRFLLLSWEFGYFIFAYFMAFLAGLVGWAMVKASAFLGPRVPRLATVWAWQSTHGQWLESVAVSAIVAVFVFQILIILVAKIFKVKIWQSRRLSSHLRQALMTTVQSADLNRAVNATNRRANAAVKGSFVIAFKKEKVAIVQVPKQVQVRKVLEGYLDQVADDLASLTSLTSGSWQDVRNALTMAQEKIMIFR